MMCSLDMTKAADLRNLSKAELEEKLVNLKKELFDLKAVSKSGRIEKPHRINEVKKDIARIFTVLNESAKR